MAYELFVDSFETRQFSVTSADYTNVGRWSARCQIAGYLGSVIETSPSNGRRSSTSLRMYGGNGAWVQILSSGFTQSTHVVIGFAVSYYTGDGTITVRFRNALNTIVSVSIVQTGQVSVTLGGVTYTSVKSISTSGFDYVEIGTQIANSGSLQVRVNGSAEGWLDLTGVDTLPSTITTVSSIDIELKPNGYAGADFDDLYITYGNELKWLGDIRVDALALTGNSTPQDWTPDTGNAWERLNNTSAGYITGTTLDDESLFALADYVPQTTAIHGVQVSAYARKTDAGSRSMAIEAKSGSTVAVGSTIALGDTTTEYRKVWLTDPDTAAAWTDGGLDALEIGVKVMD